MSRAFSRDVGSRAALSELLYSSLPSNGTPAVAGFCDNSHDPCFVVRRAATLERARFSRIHGDEIAELEAALRELWEIEEKNRKP
jgi:hypothetical protein